VRRAAWRPAPASVAPLPGIGLSQPTVICSTFEPGQHASDRGLRSAHIPWTGQLQNACLVHTFTSGLLSIRGSLVKPTSDGRQGKPRSAIMFKPRSHSLDLQYNSGASAGDAALHILTRCNSCIDHLSGRSPVPGLGNTEWSKTKLLDSGPIDDVNTFTNLVYSVVIKCFGGCP